VPWHTVSVRHRHPSSIRAQPSRRSRITNRATILVDYQREPLFGRSTATRRSTSGPMLKKEGLQLIRPPRGYPCRSRDVLSAPRCESIARRMRLPRLRRCNRPHQVRSPAYTHLRLPHRPRTRSTLTSATPGAARLALLETRALRRIPSLRGVLPHFDDRGFLECLASGRATDGPDNAIENSPTGPVPGPALGAPDTNFSSTESVGGTPPPVQNPRPYQAWNSPREYVLQEFPLPPVMFEKLESPRGKGLTVFNPAQGLPLPSDLAFQQSCTQR